MEMCRLVFKWSKCNQSTFDVVDFDIRTQNYTMSSSQNEGDQFGDDAIRVLSNDGLEVIDLTVLYRICCRRSKNFKEIGV
jgi:hypothetical protein